MTKEECEIETSKAIMEMRTNIAKLEKENAELKEQCSILADSNVCSSTCSEIKKQLTKAKKIIRNCLNLWNNVMTEETVRALIKEAEQFISEVEK